VTYSKTAFATESDAKSFIAPFSKGPYLSAGMLYGRQSLNSITSQEQISGAVQIDAMNPFKVNSDELGFYIAGGKVWPMNSWQLRTELQYNYHGKLSGSINPAFPPPPLGIPSFDTSFQTSVKAQSAFFNAFFQKSLADRFSAYVGGGVGVANKKASSTMAIASPPWPAQDSQSHSSTDFAWQLGIGGTYQMTNQVAINLAFMHSDLGKPSYGTFYSRAPSIPGRHVHSKSWEANNLVIGLLYYPDLS